jgi:long-chain acyl-CoA synthetase
VDLTPPAGDDLSTIMYTSGTTGEPKGVLLTHKSILTTIAGLDHYLKSLNEVVRFPALTSNVVLVANYVQIFQLL